MYPLKRGKLHALSNLHIPAPAYFWIARPDGDVHATFFVETIDYTVLSTVFPQTLVRSDESTDSRMAYELSESRQLMGGAEGVSPFVRLECSLSAAAEHVDKGELPSFAEGPSRSLMVRASFLAEELGGASKGWRMVYEFLRCKDGRGGGIEGLIADVLERGKGLRPIGAQADAGTDADAAMTLLLETREDEFWQMDVTGFVERRKLNNGARKSDLRLGDWLGNSQPREKLWGAGFAQLLRDGFAGINYAGHVVPGAPDPKGLLAGEVMQFIWAQRCLGVYPESRCGYEKWSPWLASMAEDIALMGRRRLTKAEPGVVRED